jgi:hypothetical protein
MLSQTKPKQVPESLELRNQRVKSRTGLDTGLGADGLVDGEEGGRTLLRGTVQFPQVLDWHLRKGRANSVGRCASRIVSRGASQGLEFPQRKTPERTGH